MNFSELKQELFARGTNYLEEDAAGQARAERWLNQAYREIANLQAWPFLVVTTTGTVGAGEVSLPDVRRVMYVTADGNRLRSIRLEELVDLDSDLTRTGTPAYWYLEGTTIKTWPTGGTITARYIKRLPPLSGTTEPVFDEEYHDLIVDDAMLRAYKDTDNFEAYASLRQVYDAGLAQMTEDYQLTSRETSYITIPDPYDG